MWIYGVGVSVLGRVNMLKLINSQNLCNRMDFWFGDVDAKRRQDYSV